MKQDFLDLSTLTQEQFYELLKLAEDIKQNPQHYSESLKQKTLLMIFDKASLRTRVSFETGLTQMGGHAIYYNISTSPLGKKETIEDTAKTSSRYIDLIMARISSHDTMQKLAQNSQVPVINAMTNFTHPCQILADLLTIKEKFNSFNNLTLAYFGDSNNNVTHSLLFGCALAGINITIACPAGFEFEPLPEVLAKAQQIAQATNTTIHITQNPLQAATNADILYADSWMSYHIPDNEKEQRIRMFKPFQVNSSILQAAKPNAVFMNCLPAMRGMEQTAEVIDGPQSIVFDQAENRLHAQKALMLWLLNN